MKPIAHLTQDLQKLKDGINKLARTLPPIIGTEAVRMARLQIDKEGTLNGGFKPWPKRIEVNSIQVATQLKRKPGGGFQAGKVRTALTDQGRHAGKKLLRRSGHLYRAISWQVNGNQVSIGVDLKTIPYAKIHNEGGTIPITAKMKAFFRARYKATNNPFWLRMANHKGSTITIPKRQFIALSPELKRAVEKAAYRYILQLIPNRR